MKKFRKPEPPAEGESMPEHFEPVEPEKRPCYRCSGMGTNKHGHCDSCNGTGMVYDEEETL